MFQLLAEQVSINLIEFCLVLMWIQLSDLEKKSLESNLKPVLVICKFQ